MQAVQRLSRPIQELNRKQYPVKILQFGSGNFLRGFADWMVQMANERTGFNAGISVVQGISSHTTLHEQEGVYTVVLKGIREEEFVSQQYKIDVIQRVVNPSLDFEAFLNEGLNPELQFIISNTMEAGIVFSPADTVVDTVAATFPGRLTQLLYHRFQHKLDNSLLVLPTEIIEQNGTILKSCIQKYCSHWHLRAEFNIWLNTRVTFCNTLVDRIVSGFPRKSKDSLYAELGYADELVVEGEWFHLWAIEGPRWIEEVLPFKKAGLNVICTHDLVPYWLRKVRILNGAHSCMACVGYLAGLQTVREAIEHPVVGSYIRRMIYDEIIPHIPGDLLELERYAEEVINRFRNPAIDHQLLSISLNSFTKFSMRVLPSLLAQVDRNGLVHERLAFALAALLFFYRGLKEEQEISLKDNEEVIALMRKIWEDGNSSKKGMVDLCRKVLSNQAWWGNDLTDIPQLVERTGHYLYAIDQRGIIESLKEL